MFQDILLHIQDVSHPDKENQIATVKDTLQQLNIDSTKIILQVANKIDKILSDKDCDIPGIRVCATDGTGT